MIADNYDVETPRYIAHGITIFQSKLINDSEEETVSAIYDALKPKSESLILDMGCGIGGVARLMLEIDGTLKFLGVTNSKFQVDYITNLNHPSIAAIYADFSNVPIPDESVDYIMLNEAIIFGDTQSVLTECFRVLKKGGRIVIKNFLITKQPPAKAGGLALTTKVGIRVRDPFMFLF
jgi:ubiquinone/menaquinone biosynthesis C-methylase UbiE